MATLDTIQNFHSQLDLVCTSLEKLHEIALEEHADLVEAASPAMLMFRELLDVAAAHGWAK